MPAIVTCFHLQQRIRSGSVEGALTRVCNHLMISESSSKSSMLVGVPSEAAVPLLVDSSTFSSVAARSTDLGADCKASGDW